MECAVAVFKLWSHIDDQIHSNTHELCSHLTLSVTQPHSDARNPPTLPARSDTVSFAPSLARNTHQPQAAPQATATTRRVTKRRPKKPMPPLDLGSGPDPEPPGAVSGMPPGVMSAVVCVNGGKVGLV